MLSFILCNFILNIYVFYYFAPFMKAISCDGMCYSDLFIYFYLNKLNI